MTSKVFGVLYPCSSRHRRQKAVRRELAYLGASLRHYLEPATSDLDQRRGAWSPYEICVLAHQPSTCSRAFFPFSASPHSVLALLRGGVNMAVALVHPETPLENLVLALLGSASLLSLGWVGQRSLSGFHARRAPRDRADANHGPSQGLILQLTIDYCYRASSSEAQGRLRTHLLVGHIFTCALAHCTLNLCVSP